MRSKRVIAQIKKMKCETIDSAFHTQFEKLMKLITQLIASEVTVSIKVGVKNENKYSTNRPC